MRPQGWAGLARTSAHEASQPPIRCEPSRIMRTTYPSLHPPPPPNTAAVSPNTCHASSLSSLSHQHHVLRPLVVSLYHSVMSLRRLLHASTPPSPRHITTTHMTACLFLSPRHTQLLYALLRHPLSQDTRVARPEALADRATERVPTRTR